MAKSRAVVLDAAGSLSDQQPDWLVQSSMFYEKGPVRATVTNRYIASGVVSNCLSGKSYRKVASMRDRVEEVSRCALCDYRPVITQPDLLCAAALRAQPAGE